MSQPSSTQIGAVAENIVANALIVESQGRLSPFAPIADDYGIDMLIYDKRTGKAMPVQVKSRTVSLKKPGSGERGNVVHFEIRRSTFQAEKYGCVIFVLLSANSREIDRAWVIPMKQLVDCAATRPSKYVVRANKIVGCSDRFSQYQCKDTTALVSCLISHIDCAAAQSVSPRNQENRPFVDPLTILRKRSSNVS